MKLGLSLKVVATVVPLVFAPLAMLAGLSFYTLKHAEQIRTTEVLRVALQNLASDVRGEIETSGRNLDFFANANDVRVYAGTKDEARRYNLLQPGFIDYLKAIRRAYPAYEELRLILPDGYEDTRVAAPDLPNLSEDESGTPLFRALKAMEGDDYSEILIHPDAHELRLLQARRLYALDVANDTRGKRDAFEGYLVLSRNLDFVQRILAELNRNIAGELLVVDAAGRVLAARDRGQLGKLLPTASMQRLQRVQQAEPSEDELVAPVFGGLYAVAVLPESVLSESAVALARALSFTAGGAVVLSSGLLLLLLGRLVVRPVKALTTATIEIGAERPVGRLPLEREDEIGALAGALDAMRTTLLERRQGLLEQNQLLAERSIQLESARDAAQAANRAKSAFLATMSHEIRTPMNGVLGMTELLLGTPLQARQRSYATTILQSGQNLLAIINDILDFSKIEEGKLALTIMPFSLGALCESVVDALSASAYGRGIELVCDLEPALFAQVEGDQIRLRQVLNNLLGNAIKFTDRGEVVLRGRAVRDQPPRIQLEICDTGIGIAADVLPHIFDPFYQVDGSATRRHGGTGLGLAIVRQLVDAMGGRISVQSREGVGTVVLLELPFDCPPAPLPVARGLALVICDSAGHRQAIQTALEAGGFEVQQALAEADPEALRAGLSRPPSLLVVERTTLQSMRRAFGAEPAGPTIIVLKRRLNAGDDANTWSNHPRTVLELPLRRREIERLLDNLGVAPSPQGALPAATAAGGGSAALVAHADMISQLMLVEMLSVLGFKCTTVRSGEELLTRYEQSLLATGPAHFRWVFMDGHMPDLDLSRVVSLLRGMAGKHAPAVLVGLGAASHPGLREACLAAGLDDYLEMPCSRAVLQSLIDRAAPKVAT